MLECFEAINIKKLRAQQQEAEERVSSAEADLRSLKAAIKSAEDKCQHDWKTSEKYETFNTLEHDINKPIYRGSDVDYELRTVEKTDVVAKQTRIVENPVFS